MKTIEQVLKEASLKLFTVTRDRTQAWLEAELLLSSALQQERVWLLAHQNTPLRATAQTRFSRLLARRLAHEPLAYIFGEAFFHGRMFLVNRSTLIPRVETEQLVAEAATVIDRAKQNTLVWDVGTGSGILAITLKALFPRFDVLATDISARALSVAKKNAKQLLQQPIPFLQANLLDQKVKRFLSKNNVEHLIVVANLPYLPKSQKRELARQVTKYEPLEALFAEKQGQKLNEELIKQLDHLRKETGLSIDALLELDPSQAVQLQRFSQKYFPNTKILHDLHNRARFLKLSS